MRPAPAMRVHAAVLEAIARHALDTWPRECCGLLIGAGDEIHASRAARNDAPGTTRYRIHPPDHFAALREARAHDLEVLGAYHSHPESAPLPSTRDRAEAIGGFLYLVVGPIQHRRRRFSLGRPGLRRRRCRGWAPMSVTLWRGGDRNFVPVPFVRTG